MKMLANIIGYCDTTNGLLILCQRNEMLNRLWFFTYYNCTINTNT